ncbi:hypothetical protein Droror1_Dr00019405 [Drosera rotundifolia]
MNKAVYYNFFPETRRWSRNVSSKVVEIRDHSAGSPKSHNFFPTNAKNKESASTEDIILTSVDDEQSPVTRDQDDPWKIKKKITDNEATFGILTLSIQDANEHVLSCWPSNTPIHLLDLRAMTNVVIWDLRTRHVQSSMDLRQATMISHSIRSGQEGMVTVLI